ncbi:MAG: hypothetical protein JWN78_1429 [Bacteroidota bacterium]|nr:hypothetical protein [Bacteroidota bacterium]
MNKKFTLFAFILASTISFSLGQVYQINTFNNQTVTTCRGIFESSGGDPNICNGYDNNETSVVTFCSGTPGRPIRVSFLTWDIEDGFDTLYVYNGTSTASPVIGTITGSGDNNTTPLFFTSTGTCLTFKFVSDNSVSFCGWEAIIGCMPVACSGNLPANDACSTAPQICDLNGYCGNTSGWYTPDHSSIGTTGSGLFCGSIENNSWVSFVASNTSASFQIQSGNCVYATSGIQAMVLASTDCNNFSARSNCVSQSAGSGNFSITTNTPLIIGTKYYLMIDGYAGNICDYTINALSGVQVITITSSAPGNQICNGSTATITAHGAPAGTIFSWTPTATIIGSATDSIITVHPTVTTTYTLVITLPNGCATQTETFTLTVNQPKVTNTSTTICQGASVTVGTHTYTQTGNYTDTLRTSGGCDSIIHLNLTVKQKSTTNITRSICQGQSVTIGNQVFTQTGNYSVTLQSANGCDSVVNLALTVNPKKTTAISRTICQGQNVVVGTHTYTQSGTFIDTLHSSAGCDSVVTLTLVVNPKKTTSISRTICQGQSVVVGTHTYTQSGTFIDTLRTSLGCDSVVTLSLTVTNRIINNISRSICQGQTTTVGTHTYSQSGNFSDTLRSVAGCDSIINLALTVIPRKISNISRTICQGQNVVVGTHTYTQTGNFTDTLHSSVGCDSIVNLTLIVNPRKTTNTFISICQGQSVVVGTHTYTQSGNFTDTLHTSTGCDSVVNLTLTVNPKKTTAVVQTICQGQQVVIGTHTYSQSGNFSDTLRTSRGCDSVVNLTLTVIDTITSNIRRSICTQQTITIGTQTFSTSGNYTVTLPSAQGCDSIIHLALTVTDSIVDSISRTICFGNNVTIGNQTFNTTGNYSVFLQAAAGCDSTVNLHLVVLDSIVKNISSTICQGQSVQVGNQVFTQTGNFTVTLISANGCDSLVRLALIVNPTKTTNLTQTICEGQTVIIGSQTFDSTGIYSVTLQTSLNCDSIVNLNLTVNPRKLTNLSPVICNGQTFTVGNQTFDSTGVFDITLQSITDCDSIVHLNLTVNPTPVIDLPVAICEGQSYTVGTQTFTIAGNYTVVIPSSLGCDSTVHLALTVNPVSSTSIERTICEGESVTIGNQTFTQAGSFTVTLQTSLGCDSVINLFLSVNPSPVIDATSDKTTVHPGDPIQLNVTTTAEGLSYSWTPSNLLNDPNIQNPVAGITEPTWFYVTATSETTTCKSTDSVFVNLEPFACTVYIPNAFTPNGDGVNDLLMVRSAAVFVSMKLIIVDRWGNIVFETSDINSGWDGMYKGKTADVDAYAYYFTGECIQGDKVSFKGNITLMR